MMMSTPQAPTANTLSASPPSPTTPSPLQKAPSQDYAMWRLAQALVVGIPLTSILAGWVEQLQRPANTPTSFDVNIHGVNPLAEEGGRALHHKANLLSEYSTDFSKAVQSAWRVTAVLPTDILRYGFRGFSQLYVQPVLEIVRRISRGLTSPMIREAILPTVNGRNLEGAREFYPHLTDFEFNQLQQEVGDLQLHQLEGLQDALTSDSMTQSGKDFYYLSQAMNVLKYNQWNPQTRRYQSMPLSSLPMLTRHIRIMTQPERMAKTSATLAKYGHREIPLTYTSEVWNGQYRLLGKAEIQHDLFTGPVGAYEHVVKTLKLGDFMPEYQQFLQLASQGRLASNGTLNRKMAERLFNLHTTEAMERDFRVGHAFLEYLFGFAQLKNKGEGQIPFGRDTLGYIKHSLLRELSTPMGVNDYNEPQHIGHERLVRVLKKVIGNESLVLDDNTTRKVRMTFDENRALNIQSMGVEQFATAVRPSLERLRSNVDAVKALLNNPQLTAEQFQAECKKRLAEFELERLRFATIFPSNNTERRGALNKIVEEGLSPQSVKNAYTFVTQGIRHYIAFHHTIPNAKKRMIVPEVLVNAFLGFSLLGFVWNALDVNRIQPYESQISDKKGNVKGAGLMLGLSILPGATLFTGLLTHGALRRWTQDSPTLRFAVASLAGLATTSFCAYHLVRGHLESKSDVDAKQRFSLNSRVEIFHSHHSEIIKQVKAHQRVHRTNERRPYPTPLKTFPHI